MFYYISLASDLKGCYLNVKTKKQRVGGVGILQAKLAI